jgi:hypothetical protein
MRVRIRVDGDTARAVLSAPRIVTQRVTLRRHGGTIWKITSTLGGEINGRLAERPATTSELGAISALAERRYRRAVGCVTYAAHISTVDPRYARVDYVYPRGQLLHPHGRCGLFVGNGEDIYVHAATGWRFVVSGTEFRCDVAPPGVVRSLIGACFVG